MLAQANVSRCWLGVIALGVALVFNCAGARASKAQAGASSGQLTAAQVLDLQKRFQDATVASDAATIAKLMADDAIFVHGNGLVQSKAEFVEAAARKRFRIRSFEIRNPKVVFFDGGAIVTGLEDIVLGPAAAGEQPRKVQLRVSDVWVARPGGWQLIFQQGTPVEAPARASEQRRRSVLRSEGPRRQHWPRTTSRLRSKSRSLTLIPGPNHRDSVRDDNHKRE